MCPFVALNPNVYPFSLFVFNCNLLCHWIVPFFGQKHNSLLWTTQVEHCITINCKVTCFLLITWQEATLSYMPCLIWHRMVPAPDKRSSRQQVARRVFRKAKTVWQPLVRRQTSGLSITIRSAAFAGKSYNKHHYHKIFTRLRYRCSLSFSR